MRLIDPSQTHRVPVRTTKQPGRHGVAKSVSGITVVCVDSSGSGGAAGGVGQAADRDRWQVTSPIGVSPLHENGGAR